MKKINNLDELVELVGMEVVERCFTEYMMLTIAKAKKYDELQGKQDNNSLVIFEEEDE